MLYILPIVNHSPFIFPGVLLFSAPSNPLTFPYSHCNIPVLTVIVMAAPAKRKVRWVVSRAANKGYG